jgi:phospholipid/cholesterol/gamma-HCH transport system substrate-binding protein
MYRKEEIKAGVVVVTALLIFSAMAIFLGGSRFWKDLDIYRIQFSAIGGLEKGASVRLGGLRVGRVVDIAVAHEDTSKIEVTIGVEPRTPIYRGVVAGIQTLGLVGDYYVLLTPHPGANEPLPSGSQISSRGTAEIGDLMVQAVELSHMLKSSIEEVVGSVNRVLSKENITSVHTALQGMSRLTAEGEKSLSVITMDLRDLMKRLDTMVTNLDGLVVETAATSEVHFSPFKGRLRNWMTWW